MSLAIVKSRAHLGLYAPLVSIEVHLSNGLPQLSIVGLAETTVRESRDRVRSALINTGFEFPAKRITISLAPADLPKEGSRFDLPIAIGILLASQQLSGCDVTPYEFSGELALSGSLRAVSGMLPFALATHEAKHILFLPRENSEEVAWVEGLTVFAAEHLLEICAHLNGTKPLLTSESKRLTSMVEDYPDLSDVRGQHQARRALEVAAAGHHSMLMIGPPGTGKTLLANRLPGILPPLTRSEAIEIAAIDSISSSEMQVSQWGKRPFRAPHHTISSAGLVGGGNPPKPGEISRAHYGVLFLDELPEFQRQALECLREPLESGKITIARANRYMDFPARFLLIAAMNPCPCGYLGDAQRACRCTPDQIQRYHGRLSGPLLDRIDMHLNVLPTSESIVSLNFGAVSMEQSQRVRERVLAARHRQEERQKKTNAELTPKEIETYCVLPTEEIAWLDGAVRKLGLSMRGYHRLIRLARTLADLVGEPEIRRQHLMEALSYRRNNFSMLNTIS